MRNRSTYRVEPTAGRLQPTLTTPPPGYLAYRHPLDPSMHVLKQESKEISKVHGRMSKDLATISARKKTCPFALTVKALSSYDTEGLGFVKVTHNLYYQYGTAACIRETGRDCTYLREITRCTPLYRCVYYMSYGNYCQTVAGDETTTYDGIRVSCRCRHTQDLFLSLFMDTDVSVGDCVTQARSLAMFLLVRLPTSSGVWRNWEWEG